MIAVLGRRRVDSNLVESPDFGETTQVRSRLPTRPEDADVRRVLPGEYVGSNGRLQRRIQRSALQRGEFGGRNLSDEDSLVFAAIRIEQDIH